MYQQVTYQPRDPQGNVVGKPFHLILDSLTVHQKQAGQIRDQYPDAAVMTARAATNRPIDQPLLGRTVIQPRDEREYERPVAVFDQTPGRVPFLFIGNGQLHWQDLMERVDEHRHYEQPIERVLYQDGGRPDVFASQQNYNDIARDAAVRRRRFYFTSGTKKALPFSRQWSR